MILRSFIAVLWFVAAVSAQQPSDSTAASSRQPLTSLEVSSIPSGATVIFDSEVIGVTPLALTGMPYGVHVLRLELEGYASFIDTIDLRYGSKYHASPRLPRTGSVRVTSEPAGVRVYLADTLVGYTPLNMSGLRPGRVSIRIQDPVYKTFRSFIFIPESDTAKVAATLEPRFVALTAVTHDPAARILVDGLVIGTGSLVDHPLETGRRRIGIEDPRTQQSVSTTLLVGTGPVHVRSVSGVMQWTPIIASTILPGSGQMLDGATVKGGMITAGFVALTGFSFVLNKVVSRRIDEYEVVRRKYIDYSGSSASELISLRKEAQAMHDKAMTAWRVNLVPIIGAAVLYAYNMGDVVLHHSRGLDLEVSSLPPTIGEGMSVQATLRIPVGR